MQIRVVTVTVLVLAALWGCGGGAVDARVPSAKPSAPVPLASAAPTASAPAKPVVARSFETERLREVTEPLTDYPITLADGVQITVQSISPPVQESVVNGAGNTIACVHVKLAADVEVLYLYNPVVVDFGNMMNTSMERLATTTLKPVSSTFAIELEGTRPVPTWEVLYKQGSATGVFRQTAFHLGGGTVFAIFDHPGFSRSYAAGMRALAASAHTAVVEQPPLYMALSLLKFDGVAVGFQEFRINTVAVGGFASANYAAAFLQGEAAVALDTMESSVMDVSGAVLDYLRVSVQAGVVTERQTLKRRGLGQYDYESTSKGIVDRGTLSGNFTSEVGDASELRDWLAGKKAKPILSELIDKPFRIAPKKITKESTGVALIESAKGEVEHCEVNSEGICARLSVPKSKIEFTVVGSFGAMPRLVGSRK